MEFGGCLLDLGSAGGRKAETRFHGVLPVEEAGATGEMMRAPAQPHLKLRRLVVRHPEIRSRKHGKTAGDRVRLPKCSALFDEHRHQRVRIDATEVLFVRRITWACRD